MEKSDKKPSEVKQHPRAVGSDDTMCTLGHDVDFEGKLTAAQDLTILGKVQGHILAKGSLIIAKEAEISATVEGQRIIVHGNVRGDIRASERVSLGPSCVVTGDVTTPVIEISEGAQFEGQVHRPGNKSVGGPETARSRDKKGLMGGLLGS